MKHKNAPGMNTAGQQPSRHTKTAALIAAATLFFSACGEDAPEPDRVVQTAAEDLPAVDVSAMNVPISLDGLEVIDPSWVTPPQYSSGIYLAASDHETALEFAALSIHGEVLWTVERPLSCTGFAVTEMSDGTPIAVLLDTEVTDDSVAANSATAYFLETGEVAWGPVDLPGTYQGPGLVFASQPDGFMGSNGPRIALNSDSGEVVSDESDGHRIVGDFSGTLITIEDDLIQASSTHTGEALWEVDPAEYGWDPASIRGSVDELSGDTYARLTVDNGPGPVIDHETGEVVREAAEDMGVDPATGTLIVLDGEGLHAFDTENASLWSITVSPETSLVTVGGIFAYLRDGDAVRVHNVLTGAVAQAYQADSQGTILVPAHLTPQGAGLLYNADGHIIVATVPEQMDGPAAP